MDEVVAILASCPELGKRVAQLIAQNRGSVFDRTLRNDGAYGARGEPTPNEALALVVLYLAAPFVQGLRISMDAIKTLPQFGDELHNLLMTEQRTDNHDAVREIYSTAIRTLPYPMQAIAARLLRPEPAAIPARPEVIAPPKVLLDLKSRCASLRAEKLLVHLSFGAQSVFNLLDAELKTQPPTPLARVLRDIDTPSEATTRAAHAAMLLKTLSRYQNGDIFDLHRFAEDFGASAAALAKALLDTAQGPAPTIPSYTFMGETVRWLAVLMRAKARPFIDALVRNDALIPKSVPALDRTKAHVPAGALRGEKLLAVQHLFPTFVPLVEACIEKGMRPQDIYILGTPYASNPLVIAYLRVLGVFVEPGVDHQGATRHFEATRTKEVRQFIDRVGAIERQRGSPQRDWVLLDDGGMLNRRLSEVSGRSSWESSMFPTKSLRAVEQTTRGLTEIAKCRLLYPVVAVASSEGKQHEGSIIGWSLADAFTRELRQVGRTLREVTIVGAGTVGLATARVLRDNGFNITILDTDEHRRDAARAQGFTTKETLPTNAEAIIGCTGKTSLDGAMLAGFSGVLASGSSAAVEFDVSQIAAHQSSFVLLNNGRPLNFHGDGYENLSKHQIGLTRALLFAGIVQKDRAFGVVPLERTLQDDVVSFWKANGGDQCSALRTDDSRELPLPEGADHDEWMTYLRNSARPVFPRVNASLGARTLYFFTTPSGEVRLIDTSRGTSQATGLPSVPERLVGDPTTNTLMAWGKDWTQPLSHTGEAWGFGKRERITRHIAHHEVGAMFGGGRSALGLAFEQDHALLVYAPGNWDNPVRLERAFKGASLYAWSQENTIVQCEKASGRIASIKHGNPSLGLTSDEIVPPNGLKRIDAVSLPSGNLQIIVATTKTNATVLIPTNAGAAPATLPAGAVFRGIRRSHKQNLTRFVVYYTLPGDGSELEHQRKLLFVADRHGRQEPLDDQD